ncbi:MAG: hypothetical protein HYY18_04160 [Planctomycetes bacterium]|nr:hypothetical protein [Planctomycetota bacterium]
MSTCRAIIAALAVVGLSCAEEQVPPAADLDARAMNVEGHRVAVLNGNAYVYDAESKKWEFFKKLYDLDFFEKNYVVEGERVFRRGDNGEKWEVGRTFRSDFEGVEKIQDLVGAKTRWTSFTAQSPRAKTVSEYVALRQRILKGRSDFLDNRVGPTTEEAHGGKTSLKTFSVASSEDMVCAKASLDTELLHFRKGDDFWFSAWYMAKGAAPFTFMDLESSWIEQYPGIRIMLTGSGLGFELKWGEKPKWKPEKKVEFPLGKWVHVVAHVKLSDGQDGVVELWQDGVKTVEGKGQTLPLPDAICNNLEVGISATNVESTLYVDDVEVSDKPLR